MINKIKRIFMGENKTPEPEKDKQYGKQYSTTMRYISGLAYSGDETADSVADLFSMTAAGKVGEYCHDDPKIQEFVRNNLEKMKGSIKFNVKKMVKDGFLQGFSGSEIVWQVVNNQVMIKEIITFDTKDCSYDREGLIFNQDNINIPLEKLILYDRGEAKIYKIRKLEYIKAQFLIFWARYIETFTSPIVVGKGDDPVKLFEALANFTSKKVITTDKNDEVDAIKVDGGGSSEIEAAMNHIDKWIYRVFFLGGSYAAGEKTGTVANSEVNERSFDAACQWIAEEIREILLEQLVRRLITYNFGEQDKWGRFEEKKTTMDEDKLLKLSQVVDTLINNGVITANDYDMIREKFGLPPMKKGNAKIALKPRDGVKA